MALAAAAVGRNGGGAGAASVPAAPKHVIGVRVVSGSGQLFDRRTLEFWVGSRLVGRGAARGAYGRPLKVRARLTAAASRLIGSGAVLRIVAHVPGEGARTLKVRLR